MTKFSDLKLDPKVLKAIAEAGYDKPTPIQAGAIPPALEGRDVLGIAQTGTGKTASFTLPVITLLGRGRARARMPRSLVLAPTRELAAQVAENFDTYAKYTRLTKALLIGGVSFAEQDKLIDRGVDVLIATPGRLLDHFERGKLLLTGVQIMVVDEADRMLDMGFIPDIERIFQLTPFTRQTLFFSATMAPEIERITDTFLHGPERIEVARQATASENIKQTLIELTPTRKDQTAKQKREILRAIIDAEGEQLTNAMIFCNRKTDVDILSKSLRTHGYDAAPIHGDLDQSQRSRTLDEFRDGKLRFLVASDVAARGLDIPAVSHVFNFDLPSHAEDYVHRIGRTGRAGRKGSAISISTPLDEKYLTAIEGLLKQALPRGEIPADFSFSSASQNAPRESNSGRGSRNGSRRSNGHHRDNNQQDARPTPEKTAPQQKPQAVEAAPERREPVRSAPQTQPEANTEQRRDRNSGGRHHDRRRSGDNQQIVGMGDHVPDFMLRCFRPNIVASESAAKDDNQPAVATTSETVSDKPQAKPAAAPVKAAPAKQAPAKPAPNKPEPVAVAQPAAEAQPAVVAVEVPAANTAVPAELAVAEPTVIDTPVTDTAPEAVAPKKAPVRRRTRAAAKPVAEPSAAQPEAEAASAASDAPVETPEPVTQTAADAPAPEAEPAKPVRKRAAPRPRKAPAAKAAATDATESPATAEPVAAVIAANPEDATEVPAKPVRRRAPRKTAAAIKAEAEAAKAAADAPAADPATE